MCRSVGKLFVYSVPNIIGSRTIALPADIRSSPDNCIPGKCPPDRCFPSSLATLDLRMSGLASEPGRHLCGGHLSWLGALSGGGECPTFTLYNWVYRLARHCHRDRLFAKLSVLVDSVFQKTSRLWWCRHGSIDGWLVLLRSQCLCTSWYLKSTFFRYDIQSRRLCAFCAELQSI